MLNILFLNSIFMPQQAVCSGGHYVFAVSYCPNLNCVVNSFYHMSFI